MRAARFAGAAVAPRPAEEGGAAHAGPGRGPK